MKGELLTGVGIGRLTIVVWSLKRHKKISDANLGNIRLNGHLCKREKTFSFKKWTNVEGSKT